MCKNKNCLSWFYICWSNDNNDSLFFTLINPNALHDEYAWLIYEYEDWKQDLNDKFIENLDLSSQKSIEKTIKFINALDFYQ